MNGDMGDQGASAFSDADAVGDATILVALLVAATDENIASRFLGDRNVANGFEVLRLEDVSILLVLLFFKCSSAIGKV